MSSKTLLGNDVTYGATYPIDTTVATIGTTYTGWHWNNGTGNSIGNVTWSPTIFAMSNVQKYSIMNLPDNEMPEAVYVDGMMLTLGIFGTDVKCAYIGGQLLFEAGIVQTWKTDATISVVYGDKTMHYNIEYGIEAGIYKKQGSTILNTVLVSTVPKK